jgi:pyruvate/2-oxoacid:ferredoxin oxidoreductase beta subunit
LESGRKGSHIHFKEFEILLFKIAKILDLGYNKTPQEKYFKLVQGILEPLNSYLKEKKRFKTLQKRNKKKTTRNKKSFDPSRNYLPNIVSLDQCK